MNRMDENERQNLLNAMASGQEALLNVLNGVSEEMALRKTDEDRWSILDCVEHLAVTEEFLFSQILEGESSDTPAGSREREAKILARGTDRTRRVAAPHAVVPHSRFSTLSEALQAFFGARERTLRYIENCEEDPRSKNTTHPILGPANCHEMLLMMSIHPGRHAKQIAEIRQTLVE